MPSHVALVPYQMTKKRFEPRSKDAPMDFTYDNPQPGLGETFSIAGQKRPLDTSTSMNMNPAPSPFPFGNASSSSYIYPFQPSLAPDVAPLSSAATLEGPELHMAGATPPRHAAAERGCGEASVAAAKKDEERRMCGESRGIDPDCSSVPVSRSRRIPSRNTGRRRPRPEGRREDKVVRRQKEVRASPERERHLQRGADGLSSLTGNPQGDEEYTSDDSAGSQEADTSHQGLGRFLSVQYYMPAPLPEKARADWSEGPAVLLGYAQFIFNASLLGAFLYLLYGIIRTVQMDVADKVKEYTMDMLAENTACSISYRANSCGLSTQAPALGAACARWERCAARDAAVVGRARIAAETFAEILNGFVDVVSWKSMLFSLLTLVIVVGATNSTLSFFRLRSRRAHQDVSTHTQHAPALEHRSAPRHTPAHHDPRFLPAASYMPHHPGTAYQVWSPPATSARKRRARGRKEENVEQEGDWLDRT